MSSLHPSRSASLQTNGLTRRQALELGLGVVAAAAFQGHTAAQGVVFPKGAVIRTLLKDLAPDELAGGATLFHEHMSLATDFNQRFFAANAAVRAASGEPAANRGGGPPAGGRAGTAPAGAPAPRAGGAANPSAAAPDPMRDVSLMTEELVTAKREGVACIVDAGVRDMGRDLEFVRQASMKSGLPVIAGGGFYSQPFYPKEISTISEEQIVQALIKQADEDPAGVFGEIGSWDEMTRDERKVFRAVGKAHVATNLSIFTHTGIPGKAAIEQLNILEDAGVNPNRVCIGHLGNLVVQLFHGGREVIASAPRPVVVSASALPSHRYHTEPRALRTGEVEEIVAAYARCAAIAADAGLDGIEVTAAHGYLAEQFFSPEWNLREDRYGEPARFATEVLEAVRAAAPSLALGVRLSADSAAARAVAPALAPLVDFIHVAMGNSATFDGCSGIVPPPPTPRNAIADLTGPFRLGPPLIATTRVIDPAEADGLVARGVADAFGMNRALIADPDMPRKARAGETRSIVRCIGCNACIAHYHAGTPIRCAQNPRTGRERTLPRPEPARARRRVAVVGAGPAGLAAAAEAAAAGHDVVVLERADAHRRPGPARRAGPRAPGARGVAHPQLRGAGSSARTSNCGWGPRPMPARSRRSSPISWSSPRARGRRRRGSRSTASTSRRSGTCWRAPVRAGGS